MKPGTHWLTPLHCQPAEGSAACFCFSWLSRAGLSFTTGDKQAQGLQQVTQLQEQRLPTHPREQNLRHAASCPNPHDLCAAGHMLDQHQHNCPCTASLHVFCIAAVGQTLQCHINIGHDKVLEWCSRPQMMTAHMQCSMLATGSTRQQNHPRPPGPRPYQSEDHQPGSHSPGESISHRVHQAVIIFLGTEHRLILHEMSCLPPPMHSVSGILAMAQLVMALCMQF